MEGCSRCACSGGPVPSLRESAGAPAPADFRACMLRGSLHRWEAGRFFILISAEQIFWSWRALQDLFVLLADILWYIAAHSVVLRSVKHISGKLFLLIQRFHGEQVISVPFLPNNFPEKVFQAEHCMDTIQALVGLPRRHSFLRSSLGQAWAASFPSASSSAWYAGITVDCDDAQELLRRSVHEKSRPG